MIITKDDQVNEIKRQLEAKGFEFSFIAISETTYGLSIYFEVDSSKFRFSNHSVMNVDRMSNEVHFKLPYYNTIKRGVISSNERNVIDESISYKLKYNIA